MMQVQTQTDKDIELDKQRAVKNEEQLRWLIHLLQQAQMRHYYGRLIISMKDGVIRNVVKEESLHPPG